MMIDIGEETIDKTLNGDSKSEELFYDYCKEIITNYLKKKYSSNYNIEDSVSEIIIKIFNNLNNFDKERAKLKSWIIKITNNHMIDEYRNFNSINNITSGTIYCSQTNNYSNSNDLSYDVSNFTVNSSIQFENQDILSHISNSVNVEDYMLLEMKYSYGYNYSEIGKEFNLSSETVSNKVNYLKTKLKKKQKKEGR